MSGGNGTAFGGIPEKGKARIAVFVSGGGTNLEALLRASEAGEIPHGEFALVLSSSETAYALERAKNHDVSAAAVPRAGRSQELFEAELSRRLEEARIDVIILAGFLSILSADFVRQWPDRILNVHPSLIPAFCGKGFYGLKVHEAALARGVKVTGATVHLVNEVPDGGPILLQKAVEVQPGDTPEVLQRRVMEQAEWVLLPRAAEMVCRDLVKSDESGL
ncbi:MAG: phosphoribosylglycinamide formyltransferase [Oscillibacter sp.]|nr:phosphoribosylglycinamide formyltransferase [Oscillibacter sp.]